MKNLKDLSQFLRNIRKDKNLTKAFKAFHMQNIQIPGVFCGVFGMEEAVQTLLLPKALLEFQKLQPYQVDTVICYPNYDLHILYLFQTVINYLLSPRI